MKVLFLVGSGGFDGPTRFALALSRHMSAHLSMGIVFCCDYIDPDVMAEVSQITRAHHWKEGNTDEIKRMIEEADCVITNGVPRIKELVGRKPQVPIVAVSHCSGEWSEQVQALAAESSMASFLVAVSRTALSGFPEAIRHRAAVIPNGTEMDRVCEYSGRKMKRRAWGVGDNARVALFMGRMAEIKRPEMMLEIGRCLKSRSSGDRPWLTVMVGDGPLRERVVRRVGRMNYEDFMRIVDPSRQVGDCLSAADVLVLPSDSEAMPMAMLEAWASGTPVVMRLHEFAVEVQQMHGPLFFKGVEGDDPNTWANAVIEAADDAQMVQYARAEAWSNYTAKAMAYRWDTYLSEVIQKWNISRLIPKPSIKVFPLKRRLHVVWDAPGWAYYHRASALAKHAPENWIVTHNDEYPEEAKGVDILLLLRYGLAPKYREFVDRYCPHAYLFGGVNIGPDRNRPQVNALFDACDAVIHNNWMSYCQGNEDDRCRHYQISNGVDTDVFNAKTPWSQRPREVGWVGSQFHKRLKGFHLLKPIADELDDLDIKLNAMLADSSNPPYTHEQMAQWYNRQRAFMVLSDSEGTPNPALEAAACGCVPVVTAVGNMPELIDPGTNGVILTTGARNTPRTVAEAIAWACEDRQEHLAHAEILRVMHAEWSWKKRAARYFDLFEKWIRGQPPGKSWNTPPQSIVVDTQK